MPQPPMSLEAANRLSVAAFAAAFGDIAEHSPWVAEGAAASRPFRSREAMIDAFHESIWRAPRERQLALLRAHPDLAGRAAIAGQLTADSRNEQAGAGLNRLTPEEFRQFTEMNTRYRDKNGIPFILAVKGATKDQILSAFASRLKSDTETEFATALQQVCRIVGFRLADRIAG